MENSIRFTYKLDTNGNPIFIYPTNQQFEPYLVNLLLSIKRIDNAERSKEYGATVILHDDKEIRKEGIHYLFGQEHFLNDEMVPIIHLSYLELDTDNNSLTSFHRYASIIDSSIWNYFIHIDKDTEDNLKETINRITANYNGGLYQMDDAKNYANLHARLTKEAYIGLPGNKIISPFVFHSETKIKNTFTKKDKDSEKIKKIKKEKWRILLFSDIETKNKAVFSLPEIIELRIKDFFGDDNVVIRNMCDPVLHTQNDEIDNETFILIDYVDNCIRGLDLLNEQKYDIILLDYQINTNNRPDFTYTIFNKFKPTSKASDPSKIRGNFKNGPNNKFFFFFFSPYTSAVFERLAAEGIDSVDDLWRISVGACPINTPQLFSYNLMRFMYRRLEDTGVLNLSPDNIYKLSNKVFSDTQVRRTAGDIYPDILDLQYTYRRMLNDVNFPNNAKTIFNTEESVLVSNFISKRVNLGGLLEHLAQLVHLTAFGTVRQWPEMWDEYIYFKSQFSKQYIDDSVDITTAEKNLQTLYGEIENHIIQLKSHQ